MGGLPPWACEVEARERVELVERPQLARDRHGVVAHHVFAIAIWAQAEPLRPRVGVQPVAVLLSIEAEGSRIAHRDARDGAEAAAT